MFHEVGDSVEEMINARGRSPAHVLEGVLVVAGAVLLAAVVASRTAPAQAGATRKVQAAMLDKPKAAPPPSAFAQAWPALSLVLTLAGLRIWNAPKSPARSRALGFWAAIQGLNALWMTWGPRRQSAQLATAGAALFAGLGFANEARKVDGTAAALVSPYLGWSSLASLITGEVWRRNKDRPTVH